METWNCLQSLTTRVKRRSSTTICDRELPSIVQNDDDVDVLNSIETQTMRSSDEIDNELVHDSTGEFHVKSSLKFTSSPSNRKEAECWKKPQIYHVPTIPPALWKVIAKLLGIPLYPGDKPYLATLLYVMTVATSFTFILFNVWFTITTTNYGKTVLNRIVETIIYVSWALLTIYSNKLAYRMFTQQSFVKYVKMHSKTILKCKAVNLITFFAFVSTGLNIYDAYSKFSTISCESRKLPTFICILMLTSKIFSYIFGFIWNLMIAVLILSVCRTHCLEIRLFIKELEKDALALDEMRRKTFSTSISSNLVNDAVVMQDSDSSADEKEMPRNNSNVEPTPSSMETRNNSRRNEYHDHFLTEDEILHRYWKLQCSLRLTSSAFKRWVVCFMLICVMWLAICLIAWLSHPPTPTSIGLFILPLIFFGIISSAIAEVNNEGQRTMRFLCPSKERLKMLIYLSDAPLHMTLYGFTINYSTLVTSAVGLVAALMSGVILQEIKSL